MTEVRPLYFVGKPTDEQRLALRKGKDKLGVDFMVRPTEAKPDVEDPVLAFEEPGFYIDRYAQLTPPFTPDRMAIALSEVLGLTDPIHLTTGTEWLSKHLGGEVKLLEEGVHD